MQRLLTWWTTVLNASRAFDMPETFVRAVITFLFVTAYMWMQWQSPKEGAVPDTLVAATSLVTGFYLTSNASVTMKAILSIIYAAAFAAFLVQWQWVPDSVNGQTLLVLGMYFGKKQASNG